MKFLKDKKILLCVTGGIAVYKAVGLASSLRKLGVELKIAMTPAATRLVAPVTFSSVSGAPVYVDEFSVDGGWIPHTELSRWADALVIAPATANTIAKIAAGMADNLVTLSALAFSKDAKVLVPTMNVRMYGNPMVKENLRKLASLGWTVVEPAEGALACGEVGKGRYPENEIIVDAIAASLLPKKLKGMKVLVTAGPTREPIDPVRYISNRSSGKMGYALARAACWYGADVILVSGPTNLPDPWGVKTVRVETAEQMHRAVMEHYDDAHVVLMAAAVADYTVSNPAGEKIKKSSDSMVLELRKTVDILEEMGKKKSSQILVGFSAETNDLQKNAFEKLKKKNLDVIVANDVSRKDVGFESDENEVVILTEDGNHPLDKMPKIDLAIAILDFIIDRFGINRARSHDPDS